jgi:hypothetical protein
MKLLKSGPLVILLGLLSARLPGPGPYRHKGSFRCEAENDKAVKVSAFLRSGISWLSEGEQTIQIQKATPISDEKWELVEDTYTQSQVKVRRESRTTLIIEVLKNIDGDLRNTLLFGQENYIIAVSEEIEIVADGNGRGKWTILAR